MSRSGTHHARPKGYGLGVVLILVAGVLWSTMGLGVRMIEHASAVQILFYRSIGLVPVLLLFITVSSGFHPLRVFSRTGPASIIGGLALIIAFFGGVISLTETTVANAVFLFSAQPIFSALLGRLVLGERLRLATWFTILIAAVGVLIMVIDGISVGKMLGNVAALTSAVGFSVFTLCQRWEKSSESMPAVLLGGIYAVIATAVALPIAGQSYLVPMWDMGVALAMGAVTLSGGLICFSIGTRSVPAGEASLLSLLEVLLSPVWVYVLFGEGAGFYTLVGGGLLLLALTGNAISGLVSQRQAASEPPAEEWREFDDSAYADADEFALAPYDEPYPPDTVVDRPPPSPQLQPPHPQVRSARIQRG